MKHFKEYDKNSSDEDSSSNYTSEDVSDNSERVIEESSESSDLISESSDLISEHSDITTHLDFHKHYDVDPEGTTPELDSPDLFIDNEEDCNIPANKVSIGTNTKNHEEVKEDRDNINMDTINKCYTLGLIIGRALSTMSKQRREHCMHNIAHCFENDPGENDMSEDETSDNKHEEEEEEESDEDDVVRAIKAEKNKLRDHPPTIICEDFIVDISLHPSKNLIAIANIVGDVLLYEYNNEETKLVNTLELHLKACRDIEFDDEGNTLFSTAKDKTIMVTDVESGKLKRCYENAHDEPVYRLLNLDRDKIVTGDDGGTVKLWDLRKPDPVFSIKIGEETVSDMITNDAHKYLVCASGDGVLTSIDLKGCKIYTTSEEYDAELTCLGLFRSDTKLLVASSTGKLYLFNWKEFGLHSDEYIGQKHAIQCMVPITQNIVVTSGEDGVLRAAHMFPQRQLGVVGQHRLPVEHLDISHDGQYVASCSHDNDVKFWNISYFESIDSIIDVNQKQNKRKDLSNNLPSSSLKNASDFFSGLV